MHENLPDSLWRRHVVPMGAGWPKHYYKIMLHVTCYLERMHAYHCDKQIHTCKHKTFNDDGIR